MKKNSYNGISQGIGLFSGHGGAVPDFVSQQNTHLDIFFFLQRGDLEQKREKIECELVENRRSLEQEKIAR